MKTNLGEINNNINIYWENSVVKSVLYFISLHCQVCGIPHCSDFNIWLYVVLPAAVALVLVAVIVAICCLRQAGHKKPLSVATSSPR